MNKITLKTDGFLAENRNVVEDNPLMFLGYRIELQKGCSLRSFFQMFDHYTLLAQLSVFLPDCIEQYRACPKSQCKSDDIDHLQFIKTVEMIGFPGKPRLDIFNALRGVRGKETYEIKSFRLESLLDMPLKLGILKHIVFGDKVDVFEFETMFTLFEFIDGIAWELSFQGTPKECAI